MYMIRSGIEVVITALTRNQVGGNVSWVRIPPTPLLKEPALQQVLFHIGRTCFFRAVIIKYMNYSNPSFFMTGNH